MACRLSSESRQVNEIGQYIESAAGPAARRTVLATIQRGLLLLGRYPWIGRARDDFGTERRSLIAGNYIISYKADGRIVTVLRIIEERRDYPPLLRA